MKFKDYLQEVKESPKFLQTNDEIYNWCKKMGLESFIIARGVVGTNAKCDLNHRELTRIPVQFGVAKNDFECAYNRLRTLRGAPSTIGGTFKCQGNKLKTLEHVPSKIGGHLFCGSNDITSLEGISDLLLEVKGSMYADWTKIKSGGIGLVLVSGLKGLIIESRVGSEPFVIIKKYLGKPELIFDCQNELIEAGFEAFARL